MKKTALQEMKIDKKLLLTELTLEVNQPENKQDENALLATSKAEIQKAEQLILNNENNKNLSSKHNKKLKIDLVLKADLEKDNRPVSTKLLDRIENNTEFLNDLDTQMDLSIVEINISNTDVKNAISALRKVDPKKAAELENTINLKSKKTKKMTIIFNK
ncbi:hypothetical protein [Pseudoalteromonas sp. 2CM32C]|uniref:hypothetical protein n=1 Tax=Pseudoalteromonas sp. 2CM32C TaxID=2929852 RepID=UPI0020C0B0F7|nr:hypothetical protein [Pseudoalteromonas sp. 2CM32C]MCK8120637.1 hypothetical protein [Pseudoalteromonas sp. 2CM32C]